jgi:hypothetical protein
MDRCREAYSKWDGFRLRLFRAWDRLIYSDNPDAKRAALIEAAESIGVDLVGPDSLNAIRSDEEHRSQCAVMTWADLTARSLKDDRLQWLFAIPNGGHRHIKVAVKLKAEGVKAGVPDLMLPVASASGEFHGLFIEMKTEKGRPSKEQKRWLAGLKANGYRTEICHSAGEAIAVLKEYLEI